LPKREPILFELFAFGQKINPTTNHSRGVSLKLCWPVLPKREPTTPPQKLREPTTLPQKFQQHLQNFHTKQTHTQPNKENIRQATRSYFLIAKQNHNLPEAKTEGKCST
jgi:hypothetical protein